MNEKSMTNRHVRRVCRWIAGVGALLVTVGAAACGNVTPGGVGEATVEVTGNVPQSTPTPAPALGGVAAQLSEPATTDSIDEAEEAEGQVHVRFLVSLVAESGSETRLGEEIEVEVDLQGADGPEVARELITATRYTELRLVFTEIKAEVEGGLIINGVPVVGELHVELEDVSLLVTRPIDLDVEDGESVAILVDLNAPAWLTAVDPLTLSVDETVFADLINVVTP
jgi:hypothetical protein